MHSELAFKLSSIEFDFLDNKARRDACYYTHKKFLRQKINKFVCQAPRRMSIKMEAFRQLDFKRMLGENLIEK